MAAFRQSKIKTQNVPSSVLGFVVLGNLKIKTLIEQPGFNNNCYNSDFSAAYHNYVVRDNANLVASLDYFHNGWMFLPFGTEDCE